MILSIILLIIGAIFLIFGYKIYFRNKYNLINDFGKDYKNGIKNEKYAKKVGLIEFILGTILFFIGILILVLK